MINNRYKTDLAKRSFDFGIMAVRMCGEIPVNNTSRIITGQLMRSATSVGANIVEARASSTRKEFKKFNEIALRSANESQYWLKVLLKLELINEHFSDKIQSELSEICRMLASGIKKLKI